MSVGLASLFCLDGDRSPACKSGRRDLGDGCGARLNRIEDFTHHALAWTRKILCNAGGPQTR
jgi:hypothetical protein